MKEAAVERPKVLFFLSRDYGELFNAVYFSQNSNFDPVFVLPPNLYALNHDSFPFPVYEYRKAADVRTAIARERPDVVLLFSGYLYVVNKVLETELGVANILQSIDDMGVPVATSDPSLGLLTEVSPDLFNERHPRYRWLIDHFTRVSNLLAERTHLYLAPSGLVSKAQHVAYYNRQWANADRAGSAVGEACWLFILSPEDVSTQNYIHGADGLLRIVAAQLAKARAAGRRAVLIAPPRFITALKSSVSLGDAVTALSACRFPEFIGLLLDAEFVFYWNQFSASIVGRVLADKPFFVFDKGHLAYAMKPLYPIARQHFYPGCRFSPLDPEHSPGADELQALAREQKRSLLAPMHENFAGGLAPEAVISAIRGKVD